METARLYGKNKFSVRVVMKNKEKNCTSFSVAKQTAKVTAVARDEVLMKVEKALNFWWNNSNKMQQLRLFFAMALLYMFRVTIPPIIRSTMLYMAFQVGRYTYVVILSIFW